MDDVVAAGATEVSAGHLEEVSNYLRKTILVLLNENGPSESLLSAKLKSKDTMDHVRKFISDPQLHVLVAQKTLPKEEEEDSISESDSGDVFNVTTDLSFSGPRVLNILFIKRSATIESDKNVATQLRILPLSEGSPYEVAHSLISMGLSPFYKAFIRAAGKADRDGNKMVSNVEKRFSELEIGLLHLQQNIEIPEVNLPPHPLVAQIMKKAADRGERAKVVDFEDKLDDAHFLNALQAGVNRWIKEIQKVTKLDRDPASGTALQEIGFWLNLERALHRIQEKRDSLEVTLTLDILKHAKRFLATVSFDSDTGLKQALDTVNDYSPLMKDFPLQDLLSATELDAIQKALTEIFNHLRKLRNTKYPLQRVLRLLEAISRDLSSQILKVLGTRRLMYQRYDEFERVMVAAFDVFRTWDSEYEKLLVLMREKSKKSRDEQKIVWSISPSHKKLQERLEHLRKFRNQHEQLSQVIVRVLQPTVKSQTTATNVTGTQNGAETTPPSDAASGPAAGGSGENSDIDDVMRAFDIVKEIDVLDVSKEGCAAWDIAIKRYDERIDRVETRITARLRDLLGTAKNANEMFRYFSRFNALFVRPHIRGAIREYQTQLIQRVKDDIEALHEKFKVPYSSTQGFHMSKMRDLPPVSGAIIWARQIERQLNAYLRRVEAVLGKDWEHHVEGQKLKADGESFKLKLNTNEVFEDWSRKVQQRPMSVSGRIFYIEPVRVRVAAGRRGDSEMHHTTILKLRVNFHPDIMTLAKEADNMRWLGFRVPLLIVNKAHHAHQFYPCAMFLMESIRTYENICTRIDRNLLTPPSNDGSNSGTTDSIDVSCGGAGTTLNIAPLCAAMRRDVQTAFTEGCQLMWESYRLDNYVQKLTETIFHFQEKVDELLLVTKQIEVEVRALETCSFMKNTFDEILGKIQKAVDDLSLKQFSNLAQWVTRLDEEVERRLVVRLEAGLVEWTRALRGNEMSEDVHVKEKEEEEIAAAKKRIGGDPQIRSLVHELRITNQQIHLHPSIEVATQELLLQLANWENIILRLPRIQHSRYQVGIEIESEMQKTYRGLLASLPNGGESLANAHAAISRVIRDAEDDVKQWCNYQALWDLQPEQLYTRIGSDLQVWMNVLNEIKVMRKHFDVSETQKIFGPLVIMFDKVQSKVSLKYDNLHKEILGKFGSHLGQDMETFYDQVSKSRNELERQSLETGNTSDAVNVITYTQSIKRKTKQWEKQVELYRAGQSILYRDRFQFPANWRDSDYVQGEWSAFQEILKRKDNTITQQMASVQMKVVAEDKVLESKTIDILSQWDKEKPVAGNLKPEEAVSCLKVLETKFQRLKEERENMQRAKEALELTEHGVLSSSEERVQVAIEELQDLKSVWVEISNVWEQVDQMKEIPWQTVQPKKLRQQLDSLSGQLKELPSKFRQYSSFEHVKGTLQNYGKVNILVMDLKSEALKERHWKQLMRTLGVNWSLSDMSLGQLWDLDLQKNEQVIREVLIMAQGEKALEEFLKEVTEIWKNYNLELINYQNKCRLIRGWDDLFNKVKEHINSVTAMKMSPYYKQFEEEASAWEERLNRINALFDIWIDVQRRWVYLDGIFAGSADINILLPVESQRFQGVSTEFLGLMKKVSKSPAVMDVINIQNVMRQLERLADLLGKIQKSLGEYLERQRASFPRFYFVGDEDLLEIIGNSKNVPRLQKHFKKMFAGVHSIQLNEDNTVVLGITSKEGEEVPYVTPVSIKDNPRINDWLTLVEKEMRVTLAKNLDRAMRDMQALGRDVSNRQAFLDWVDKYQTQIVTLAAQINWSEAVELALATMDKKPGDDTPLKQSLSVVENTLTLLADTVLYEQPPVRRKKLEHLIIEHVHQRDVLRQLIKDKISSNKSFDWLSQMRFYFDPKQTDPLQQLSIQVANAKFNYGFEYLGIADKLVQTPLTDRCYLTMTQALEGRLGGSPFGPAGTGKTESVKALGNQLGRFVLVFNCDETFDFLAMGRIFVGLCQVGAWGCFDEFNRLEERMLSAVSQQIQGIQEALRAMALAGPKKPGSKEPSITVDLLGRAVTVNPDMAIFITMNPGYAGRSNLPDNLKKLFRSLAMTQPDRQLIAQVMLYSQGFRTAEKLASKVVPFFKLCDEQLSPQSHYDFGLRALKSVLVSAGNVKRDRIRSEKQAILDRGETVDETAIAEQLPEQEILIQSVMETMVPKLVAEDIPLLYSLLSDVFPGVQYCQAYMAELRAEIRNVCNEMHLVYDDTPGSEGAMWVNKVLQLYQITCIHHGLMMVGPSGSGKSMAWRVLLRALERYEKLEGVAHVIDPKSISKDFLYGCMDPNTREWTDGLFTHILRKIIDSVRGEGQKRQWIIFDGDVDPEWVENLNSVLDDNKLLTLPNGERLGIPPNVRIMFEVQDLRYATLATVSRCGMVWFSEDVLPTRLICQHFLNQLKNTSVEEGEEAEVVTGGSTAVETGGSAPVGPTLQLQRDIVSLLDPHFTSDGLVIQCLEHGRYLEHIMDYTRLRALTCLFSMLKQAIRNILNYNHSHSDFPLTMEQLENYVPKYLVNAIIWSMSGDGKLKIREAMGQYIRGVTTISLPANANLPIIDFEVTLEGEWVPWSNKVPQIEIETHKITATDVVIPTLDTVRHEALLYTWLAEHRPMLLCGPPGSGKTMTLFSALRCLPDMEVVGLNFSSATTPELMMKTFDQYCEYKKTPNGLVLAPIQLNKRLIFFCDEINLPDQDKYGTQRVISFLRQMVEHQGFYRTTDMQWVTFERIQFVGACNPPTDPGRKPLSHRFLRHVPIVYVDYPGEISLKQIYGTFNRAMLRMLPSLRSQADSLTNAMVEFFLLTQQRFTHDMQPHYIYSPREMTRWVRGIHEALKPLENLSVEGLVRIWAHEALRLFQDRLVEDGEREWTDVHIDECALRHFPNIDKDAALKRPILFSNWITKEYSAVDRDQLREYVKARLRVFYEEELDVKLVLFNQVLDHVLRIDRVFRQPQGHLLLIGVSGAGKTTLSRFVSWINGLSVFQVKVHNKYSAEDFDEDLRTVLRRSGCKGEKITFIMDESNVMDSSFLERMNTLLANGEVPGLFEGDEFTTLMTQCKEGAARVGLMIDSHEELYKWFTQQICRNLHVVFTMNPSADGLKDRASTSPALFNRCVLNWFGDWSEEAFFQVGREFTEKLELDRSDYYTPDYPPPFCDGMPEQPTHRDMLVNACVFVHQTMRQANQRLVKRGGRSMAITPRHYLDLIAHYVKLMGEKKSELVEQQLHLNVGLQKIKETVEQVEVMQKSLTESRKNLEDANAKANAKLKQMMQDQHEAMVRKEKSQVLQKNLAEQEIYIAEKRTMVMNELSDAEPAVEEAKNAVKSIRKKDIQEIKAMKNPPPIIKLALDCICLLLGEKVPDWKAILQVIVKDNFVPNILNFDTDTITDATRKTIKQKYLVNPDFNYEKVNHASIACGPMVKWAIAQINYSDMLTKVDPLRNELKSLETQAAANKAEADEVERVITHLEVSIAQYKTEYAELVSTAETIKANLQSVEAKVGRSVALLRSLGSESGRWEATSETFRAQMSTIIGDCLLSGAFMAYAGYYDQHMRQCLFATWSQHLEQAGILFRQDLARVEYLSNPDDRLRWQANALPADELCTENAIIMTRYNRYPLIIDPSGQATEFLINEYRGRKLQKTSFLDDSFRKSLESALRFGTALLVQDVESYDAILNPVLNKEVRRTGGRTLITIGDQDIDISPTFTIFLSTRDPSVEFPPDICSRVTFVNFTVTRSSLQNQCLNAVLKSERPDVDAKRSDLLKLQGEFQLRLRHLEKDLLQALNEAKGNILEDDKIISRLETLKQEAADVAKKVAETDVIMAEVESVSQQYEPLAQSCSNIYFTLEALNQIHFLYQYSLHFLLEIFNTVLTLNPKLKELKDCNKRLQVITNDLFQVTYNRVARGMFNQDQLVFALLMSRIYLRGTGLNLDIELHHFLRGQESALLLTSVVQDATMNSLGQKYNLSTEQLASVMRLKQLPAFKQIEKKIKDMDSEFVKWIDYTAPESNVIELWDAQQLKSNFGSSNASSNGPDWPIKVRSRLNEMLLVQAFRPDRLLASAQIFVGEVMGHGYMDEARGGLHLNQIVEEEIKANTPVLLCAVQGYDPSSHVEDLAKELGKQITGIAIGSAEGFSQAEQTINASAKSGRWVMLKNVHLAPGWLAQLEKKLHSLQPNPQFRLFLTMEINPKVPVNLLRAGRILVFEPPPGIKANLIRTLSNIPPARLSKIPTERSRLYFLLSWFNAVVQERLRYTPLGWSKRYEFNESDLRCACDTIDTWIDGAAMGRTNLPPEKVPWGALRTLMAQCIYGGKIDNAFDHTLMNTFLDHLFTEKSFEHEFELVPAVDGDKSTRLTIPDNTKYENLVEWANKLPDIQTPAWLGLPTNAEKVLLSHMADKMEKDLMKLDAQEEASDDDKTSKGQQLITGSMKMQQALSEADDRTLPKGASAASRRKSSVLDQSDVRPAWMRQLEQSTKTWQQLLPKTVQALQRTIENIKDPMYRCFEREVNTGLRLLQDVHCDLNDVALVCRGEKKPTNHHRSMMSDLAKGIIPSLWRRYTVPSGITVIQWVQDFALRVQQLIQISEAATMGGPPALKTVKVWLGGLFMAEAYITATRQSVAQANSWALEELSLDVELFQNSNEIQNLSDGFVLTGLRLMGSKMVDSRTLELSSEISTDLPVAFLRWIRMDKKEVMTGNHVRLPIYLNGSRAQLLFTLEFHTKESGQDFYKRGVAILSSTLG